MTTTLDDYDEQTNEPREQQIDSCKVCTIKLPIFAFSLCFHLSQLEIHAIEYN